MPEGAENLHTSYKELPVGTTDDFHAFDKARGFYGIYRCVDRQQKAMPSQRVDQKAETKGGSVWLVVKNDASSFLSTFKNL